MYGVSFVNFKNKTITTFYGVLITVFFVLELRIGKGKFLSESSREVVNNLRSVSQMLIP
jgi:hypothetical protein